MNYEEGGGSWDVTYNSIDKPGGLPKEISLVFNLLRHGICKEKKLGI
jgi:hypothetical protein